VEELVADRAAMDARLADPRASQAALPRLLTLSLAGLGAWSALQVGLAAAVDLAPHASHLRAVGILAAAYAGGIPGATAALLPTLVVGALLAGVRVPAWQVSAMFSRSLAETVVTLAGVMPIYALAALGLTLVDAALAEGLVLAGYGLPFAAGLAGRRALGRSFDALAEGPTAARARALVGACTALLLALSFAGTARLAWVLG